MGTMTCRTELVTVLMTRHVVSVLDTTSVAVAFEQMKGNHIRHLPILNAGGVLVGLLSDRDVLAMLGVEHAGLQPVANIMQRDVQVVGPACCVEAAARFMLHSKKGCLPVLDDTSAHRRAGPDGQVVHIDQQHERLTALVDHVETREQRLQCGNVKIRAELEMDEWPTVGIEMKRGQRSPAYLDRRSIFHRVTRARREPARRAALMARVPALSTPHPATRSWRRSSWPWTDRSAAPLRRPRRSCRGWRIPHRSSCPLGPWR